MTLIVQQLTDALGIMLLGMGLVFIFLSMLIIGINLVARRYAPTPTIVKQSKNESLPARHGDMDPKLLAAITVAIHQYRAQA